MVIVGLLSLLVGLVLGLLGGGGSILSVPVLAYAAHLSPREAIATSLVVVGLTAAVGTFGHARAGTVRWRSGLLFGSLGMAGAYGGGRLAGHLPGNVLLLAFAGVLLVAGVLLLRRRANVPGRRASPARLAVTGLGVGGITGLVGAGGGFAIVPALVLFGGLGMHEAIGTSLFVIALQSAAGLAGHLEGVHLDATLAAGVSAAAIGGSLVGARLARRVEATVLRRTFASLVIGMAVWMGGTEGAGLLGLPAAGPWIVTASVLAASVPLFRLVHRRRPTAPAAAEPVLSKSDPELRTGS